jgi:hypothetical protein
VTDERPGSEAQHASIGLAPGNVATGFRGARGLAPSRPSVNIPPQRLGGLQSWLQSPAAVIRIVCKTGVLARYPFLATVAGGDARTTFPVATFVAGLTFGAGIILRPIGSGDYEKLPASSVLSPK